MSESSPPDEAELAEHLRGLSCSERLHAVLTVAITLAETGGDRDGVDALVASCEAAFEDVGDAFGLARCAVHWGIRALERGDVVAAGQAWRRALELAPLDAPITAAALVDLAVVVCDQAGDWLEAAALVQAAVALRRRHVRASEAASLRWSAPTNG